VQPAIAFTHAEIVHRQNVRAAEGEDQQHLNGPAPDAADRHQPLDQLGIGQPHGTAPRRHGAGQRMRADIAQRRRLGAGKAAGPQRPLGQCQDIRRRRKAWMVGEMRGKTGEHGFGGTCMQLLMSDCAHQRFVRRAGALDRQAASPDMPDQCVEGGIAAQMTDRFA
jgi:hypothetical protein